MLEIPPIRSYKPLEQLGPGCIAPNIRINKGDDGIRLKLWFDFGNDPGPTTLKSLRSLII